MLGGKELLIILVIIILIFGTSKLKNLGGDLGSAIKNFKKAVKDGETEKETATEVDEQKPKDPS
jgi:sec-independent protein translocase protein TatA